MRFEIRDISKLYTLLNVHCPRCADFIFTELCVISRTTIYENSVCARIQYKSQAINKKNEQSQILEHKTKPNHQEFLKYKICGVYQKYFKM